MQPPLSHPLNRDAKHEVVYSMCRRYRRPISLKTFSEQKPCGRKATDRGKKSIARKKKVRHSHPLKVRALKRFLPARHYPRPSPSTCRWCSSTDKAFVKMSAVFRLVRTLCSSMSFDSMASRIKWWRISMCFIRSWCFGFLASSIAPLLSIRIN